MPSVLKIAQDKGCSTAPVLGLSHQIIAELNTIVPQVLVSLDDLPITIGGSAVNAFAQPAAKQALKNAIAAHGGRLSINSAYRTVAQQYLLRAWVGSCGITAAALPGKSNHENGLALDIKNFASWRDDLEAHHWKWLGPSDKVHFSYTGPGVRSDLGTLGIKAFQQLWNRHNPDDRIEVDGQFGPQTQRRLEKSPAEGFESLRPLFIVNPLMEGNDVLNLQRALVAAGFASKESGVYEESTKKAVMEFQERQGLAVDGVVGPSTYRALGLL